jgi:homospermidine synthase
MEAIRGMTKKNNYHFYSFRHTIITILTLEKTNIDFVDYVTGHKSSSKIRDNYTHINTVNTELFCREYGKLYLDTVEKYFFPPRKTREEQKAEQEKALREYIASRKKDRDSAGHEGGEGEGSIFESI